jgi:dipeptidase E
MKLLLTSGGLTNRSISRALFEMVGKEPQETSLAFVPTAANAEKGDKGWLIDDLAVLKRHNFRSIDIADISAGSKDLWLAKLEDADVLYFAGGKRYHLMEWLVRTGLSETLATLLAEKVYAGMSAGSMVTGKDLGLVLSHSLYNDDLDRKEELPGLGYVDFRFLPHFNNPYFKKLTKESIEAAIGNLKETIYAMDDNSALQIIDGQVTVIGEGDWLVFNA